MKRITLFVGVVVYIFMSFLVKVEWPHILVLYVRLGCVGSTCPVLAWASTSAIQVLRKFMGVLGSVSCVSSRALIKLMGVLGSVSCVSSRALIKLMGVLGSVSCVSSRAYR